MRAEYVLTGPDSLTQSEQISTIAHAIGRSLRIEETPPGATVPGLPPTAARMLLEAWAAAAGHPAFISSTFQEVTGTPPRSFLQWASENAGEF